MTADDWQLKQEPTLEEILAAIRRIIADDERRRLMAWRRHMGQFVGLAGTASTFGCIAGLVV